MTERFIPTQKDILEKQKRLNLLISQLDNHLERSTHKEPNPACHKCFKLTYNIRCARIDLNACIEYLKS